MSTGEDGARRALLSDSEATLRQVTDVLSDFSVSPDRGRSGSTRLSRAGDATESLLDLVGEIGACHADARALVSSAVAEVRDDLDFALELVGELDSWIGRSADADAVAVRAELRRALRRIADRLSFEDVAIDRLGQAARALREVQRSVSRTLAAPAGS